jgi:nucleotide-binding universal stress UspA family protein
VTGRILVPLRRGDRIKDVIPYLEQIAGPGSRVIFLVHYSVESLDWFQSEPMMSVIKEQKLMADNNTFLALEPLRERDVTVALDIYAGPLRKVVKQYTGRGDIDLVMIAARGKSWLARLFQNSLLSFNFSCLSKSSSVLLLRPDIAEREQ